MAKPNGACEPADFPYVVAATAATTPEYIHFGFKLPLAPRHWTTNSLIRRYKVTLKAQVSVSAGDDAYIDWFISNNYLTKQTISGTKVKSWEDASDPPIYLNGNAIPISTRRPANTREAVDTGPRFDAGYVRVYKDALALFSIYALHIEFEPDVAYSTVRSYSHQAAELTDRTNAALWLYKPNRSCSAWHMQNAIAHTYNKIVYNARWGITVPCFGGD
jgi:hypothetical protein